MKRCLLFLPLLLPGLAGCDRPDPAVRRYQEIAVTPERPVASAPAAQPAASDMASTPVQTAETRLTWTTPPGWTEGAARPMRLATFVTGSSGRECVMTVFPGDVGGLEANLQRWLGQLQVTVAPDALSTFARAPETFQSEGGLPCLIYDFASVVPAEAAESLLAAVVPLEGSTAFVKLGGTREQIAAEKENFLALCRSLKP
jgi:hypothetical protein